MKHQLPKAFFVTGIGTEVGKTVVSAILVETLKAHYWKPVQAGDLENTDTMKIQQWVSHQQVHCYPEQYRFTRPMSPHAAAEREGVRIRLDHFQLPQTQRPLVVEGAGGLMVPLNDQVLVLDLIVHLKLPVILVSRTYLGSINHTLLSILCLQSRNVPILGIIFNGPVNYETEAYILQYTHVLCLARLEEEKEVSSTVVSKYARIWQTTLEVPQN
ncbi:dethiobiotin synthase [Deltaproteobacteria bacterium TL4]